MKHQTQQEKLMEIIKSNLRTILFSGSADSYSAYIARLTLDKIIEHEKGQVK